MPQRLKSKFKKNSHGAAASKELSEYIYILIWDFELRV